MEDREMPRMHKYGASKTTRIMIATVRHATSSSELRKFQTAWFLLNRGYKQLHHWATNCCQCLSLRTTTKREDGKPSAL